MKASILALLSMRKTCAANNLGLGKTTIVSVQLMSRRVAALEQKYQKLLGLTGN
jgi:hypothetical protein